MITIIHGSNLALTRNELNNFRLKYPETVTLDGKNLVLKDLQLALGSQSLFGLERLIIIENFFNGRKNRDDVISYLQETNNKVEIVFWEDKESKSKDLSKLSGNSAKVIVYNLPVVIFKFLDSFFPGNAKTCMTLLEEVLLTNEPEMILFMLVKQIRFMLLTKVSKTLKEEESSPPDYSRLAPWQNAKLFKQAELFRQDKLKKMYEEILQMEYNQKSGKTNIDSAVGLKLFLMRNL